MSGITSNDNSFLDCEKAGLYKAIFLRRDVRSQFDAREIPGYVLDRILRAAHHAPSVGYSQPWDFILIKDYATRTLVKKSFIRERAKSISLLQEDTERQKLYIRLKLEGILESAINICVTYDPTRFGPFVLGRTSTSDAGIYSVCCAIQNLWLAARVEGIGIGWVSIISISDLRKILSLPDHVLPVAYLCAGYVSQFSSNPDLEKAGWLERMTLQDVIHYEKWHGQRSDIQKIFISPMTEILNQVNIRIVFLHNKIKPNHYSHKYSKNTILLNNGYEGI